MRRPFKEELHDRSEKLQLHLSVLVSEALEETIEQLISVIDTLSVLSDNPHHTSSRFGLIQRVQILAQSAYDALVLIRIFPAGKSCTRVTSELSSPEDVFDDDDCFLNDVVDLRLDEIEECSDAPLGGRFDFDRTPSDGSDGFPYEIDVHFGCVFFKFTEHLSYVRLRCQSDHYVELLELHVNWVVVLDEEDLSKKKRVLLVGGCLF